MADERKGYAFSDRATYVSMRRKLDLVVLVEGDPALRNPYGIILVDPARHPGINARGAKAVHEYLTSPEGQARIGAFRVEGEALFHPGAGG
jgi:tungstate transport system substrate-binding protein